ncbi:MAG: hypothetical protein AVDCRST_MAG41-999, partial [uncultured Corynebacteriales bacterium]
GRPDRQPAGAAARVPGDRGAQRHRRAGRPGARHPARRDPGLAGADAAVGRHLLRQHHPEHAADPGVRVHGLRGAAAGLPGGAVPGGGAGARALHRGVHLRGDPLRRERRAGRAGRGRPGARAHLHRHPAARGAGPGVPVGDPAAGQHLHRPGEELRDRRVLRGPRGHQGLRRPGPRQPRRAVLALRRGRARLRDPGPAHLGGLPLPGDEAGGAAV